MNRIELSLFSASGAFAQYGICTSRRKADRARSYRKPLRGGRWVPEQGHAESRLGSVAWGGRASFSVSFETGSGRGVAAELNYCKLPAIHTGCMPWSCP